MGPLYSVWHLCLIIIIIAFINMTLKRLFLWVFLWGHLWGGLLVCGDTLSQAALLNTNQQQKSHLCLSFYYKMMIVFQAAFILSNKS